ncbi:MAG: hypothetical protein JXQ84_02960 [Rhodospirillaceae bacterium]|nr:hypothetical protein [Rhodospirillaceae bacterium]
MTQGRGRILPPVVRMGRVRSLPGASEAKVMPSVPRGDDSASWNVLKSLFLIAALPMFLQSFHYMIDAGPLYYLSKAWPVLAFPLGFVVLRGRLRLSQIAYGLTLIYVAGVTPTLSMLYFGNSVFDALATTAKIWPLTYYFSALGGLLVLRPGAERLRTFVLGFGVATFVVMWLLWAFVPRSFYVGDASITKLFLFDDERGYRIYMPMTFGLILMFFSARRALSALSAWMWWGPVVLGMVSLLMIYKQRTTIAAVFLVLTLIILRRLPRRWLLWAAGGCGALGLLALLVVVLGGDGGWVDAFVSSLGASLSVRQDTAAKAAGYLFVSPVSWVFGVGSVTRFSQTTLHDVFGTNLFYLADIGWLGVVFEYGVIGALLISLVYVFGVRRALLCGLTLTGTPAGDFRRALGDMILMVCFETAIYSPVFTPGIVAALTAVLIYLDGDIPGRDAKRG